MKYILILFGIVIFICIAIWANTDDTDGPDMGGFP
jgi:hypothetical protein